MNLRHTDARPLVIGHRGAASVAPPNTLPGLEAAVAAGADLVEFDVGLGLILGHPGEALDDEPPALDDALGYLAPLGVGIHIDLKARGIEPEVAAAIRRHGVGDRVVVSSPSPAALRRMAGGAGEAARALTYPQDRHGASQVPWPGPVIRASAAALRSAMPVRARLLLAAGPIEALSMHHALVSAPVVRLAHGRGAAVIAWTANTPASVERLARLGVDAIVSDDPGMALGVLATLNWL